MLTEKNTKTIQAKKRVARRELEERDDLFEESELDFKVNSELVDGDYDSSFDRAPIAKYFDRVA